MFKCRFERAQSKTTTHNEYFYRFLQAIFLNSVTEKGTAHRDTRHMNTGFINTSGYHFGDHRLGRYIVRINLWIKPKLMATKVRHNRYQWHINMTLALQNRRSPTWKWMGKDHHIWLLLLNELEHTTFKEIR